MSRFSKIARTIVLSVLFGMLIVSFVFWGIGDMLRIGRSDAVVAEIGSAKITARDVRDRFDRLLQREQARGRSAVSFEDAVRRGWHGVALQEAVKAAVIDLAMQELGIAVSDDQVRKAIAEIPGFWGPTGKFDQNTYRAALQRAGLSEAGFVADLRRELASNQMLGSIQGGVTPPTAMRDALYRYRREKRVAEFFVLPFDSVRDVAVPTMEQLQAHLEANKAKFEIPEFRALSYVLLSVDDVLAEVSITDDQLQRTYNDRLAEFATPERRDVDQVVTANEDEARRIVELVRGGKSLEDAARESLGREAVIKLGLTLRKDLIGDLAEGVFALEQAAVGGPFRSPLGWHVARVNRIEPGKTPSFAELRARLDQDLRREAAPDILYRRVRDFDVALGRSDTLVDAAKAVDAKVYRVDASNRQGATPVGGRAFLTSAAADILETAFKLGEGQQSAVVDTRDGDSFVVRVEKITPARQPGLAEIEAVLRADWQRAEREKLTEARATEIVGRLNAVASFESQARAAGQAVKVTKPLDRYSTDRDAGFGNELVAELFKLASGRSAARKVENGVAILRLKELAAADPQAAADDARQFAVEIGSNMASDLVDTMLSAFERRYGGVKVNQQALRQAFRTEQQ